MSGKLLDAVYCPICGCKLHVDEAGGKRRLLCDRHGEMNVYLGRDPKVAKLDLGVEDLEAP